MYLTDMGMAKIKVGCATMTQVQLVGTPYYAAPETYDGNVGKPSDVWSLGMIFWNFTVESMLGVKSNTTIN